MKENNMSAVFPHSADHHKMYYGIQFRQGKRWIHYDTPKAILTEVADVYAFAKKKERDAFIKELQKTYPEQAYRKSVIHFVVNTIPLNEEEVIARPAAKTAKRATTAKNNS